MTSGSQAFSGLEAFLISRNRGLIGIVYQGIAFPTRTRSIKTLEVFSCCACRKETHFSPVPSHLPSLIEGPDSYLMKSVTFFIIAHFSKARRVLCSMPSCGACPAASGTSAETRGCPRGGGCPLCRRRPRPRPVRAHPGHGTPGGRAPCRVLRGWHSTVPWLTS